MLKWTSENKKTTTAYKTVFFYANLQALLCYEYPHTQH